MHDEYFFVTIVAQTEDSVVEYRNMVRMRTLVNVMQFAMNDCFTTIPHCKHLLSIHIRRWELLTAAERREVSFLETQRKIREENLKGK